jgi:hypothetical protein
VASFLLLLAVLGWVTYVVLHTHVIPALADIKDFMTGAFLTLYGVNKVSSTATSLMGLFNQNNGNGNGNSQQAQQG